MKIVIVKHLDLWLIKRNGRPEVLCEKAVLRNCAKFTGKYLCQGLTFNKVVGLRLASCFRVIFALVSQFAGNTRVIVDASSNPPVFRLKLL